MLTTRTKSISETKETLAAMVKAGVCLTESANIWNRLIDSRRIEANTERPNKIVPANIANSLVRVVDEASRMLETLANENPAVMGALEILNKKHVIAKEHDAFGILSECHLLEEERFVAFGNTIRTGYSLNKFGQRIAEKMFKNQEFLRVKQQGI
jgi:hypothetical protein